MSDSKFLQVHDLDELMDSFPESVIVSDLTTIGKSHSDNKEEMVDTEEKMRVLNIETQAILLKTFENFYKHESETMISIISKSRNDIKDSVLDLINDQVKHKEELNTLTEGKYSYNRKKGFQFFYCY
jgi:hypothetical protein